MRNIVIFVLALTAILLASACDHQPIANPGGVTLDISCLAVTKTPPSVMKELMGPNPVTGGTDDELYQMVGTTATEIPTITFTCYNTRSPIPSSTQDATLYRIDGPRNPGINAIAIGTKNFSTMAGGGASTASIIRRNDGCVERFFTYNTLLGDSYYVPLGNYYYQAQFNVDGDWTNTVLITIN